MQGVIVLALMVFLANYGVLYSVLPAATFADDPNPLLIPCCEVRPDGNVLPQAGGAQLHGSFLSLAGKLSGFLERKAAFSLSRKVQHFISRDFSVSEIRMDHCITL